MYCKYSMQFVLSNATSRFIFSTVNYYFNKPGFSDPSILVNYNHVKNNRVAKPKKVINFLLFKNNINSQDVSQRNYVFIISTQLIT